MSPLNVLTGFGLACWSTIFVGFSKRWIRREDIFEFAMSQLLNGCESEQVAILAGGEYLSDEEILEFLSKQIEVQNFDAEKDKWRLAFLACIDQSKDSDENKINNLQEVYADFDYPEDMASCSIYSQDGVGPLIAMSRVLDALRGRFLLR